MNTETAVDIYPLAMGLGLDEVPARLIVGEANEPLPCILAHRNLRSEKQFHRYWDASFGNRRDFRRVRPKNPDALNLLSWLEGQGVAIEAYRDRIPAQEIEVYFNMWNLPLAYQTAYTLALHSAHRLHASSMIASLRNNA